MSQVFSDKTMTAENEAVSEGGCHRDRPLVIVRGAGDIATGAIQKLRRAGFDILCTEIARPSAIRRYVALSEAVYDGVCTIEDVTARLCTDYEEARKAMGRGEVALMIDPDCASAKILKPDVVVDAILAKKNLGTHRGMAPCTVAIGPGFVAGEDVDIVVETMRGHQLGRLIFEGSAIPNTGVPGLVAGHAEDRVIHAPASGTIENKTAIRDIVREGQILAVIHTPEGSEVPIPATIDGVLRGLIRDGFSFKKGFKIADIDARLDQVQNCDTISDKARCVGGGALEAVLLLLVRRGYCICQR